MSQSERRCPNCEAEDLLQEHLSLKGSACPVMFGGTLFKKTELLAYACKECGHVSLYLGEHVEDASSTD